MFLFGFFVFCGKFPLYLLNSLYCVIETAFSIQPYFPTLPKLSLIVSEYALFLLRYSYCLLTFPLQSYIMPPMCLFLWSYIFYTATAFYIVPFLDKMHFLLLSSFTEAFFHLLPLSRLCKLPFC